MTKPKNYWQLLNGKDLHRPVSLVLFLRGDGSMALLILWD